VFSVILTLHYEIVNLGFEVVIDVVLFALREITENVAQVVTEAKVVLSATDLLH
jgi:hypothetical protein